MKPSEEFARRPTAFEVDPGITHHFIGKNEVDTDLYLKRIVLDADHYVVSHSHPYTHMSVLTKGRVVVETDRSRMEYTAPSYITIEADLHHRIGAIEPSIWYCVHATDCNDPEAVDDVILRKG